MNTREDTSWWQLVIDSTIICNLENTHFCELTKEAKAIGFQGCLLLQKRENYTSLAQQENKIQGKNWGGNLSW